MRRSTVPTVPTFLVLLALLSGCPATFASVRTTANLGIALDGDSIVVNDWIADCEAGHAAESDTGVDQICLAQDGKYKTMVATVHSVSNLLQAYATNLLSAADDKDVTVSDDFTSIMHQIGTLNTDTVKRVLPGVYNLAAVLGQDSALTGKLTPSGVVTIVDTLVGFASQSFRRDKIATAVVQADPHVDVLAAFLHAEIRLHLDDIVTLRKAFDDAIPSKPLANLTPAVGQMLPLVAATLDARIASLEQLDAACQAFRQAHHALAERIRNDKPWQNGELLAEIKKDVLTIAGAFNGNAQ